MGSISDKLATCLPLFQKYKGFQILSPGVYLSFIPVSTQKHQEASAYSNLQDKHLN